MNPFLKHIASFLSFIFSPLLMATYAVWAACRISILAVLPMSTLLGLTGMVFAITCLFPMIAIAVLYKLRIVSTPGLNKRTERTIPFLVSCLSYAGLLYYFIHIATPFWLVMFAAGGLLSIVICCIVNLKWKISVHLTAAGAMTALIFRLIFSDLYLVNPFPWLIAAILITGAVASARLYLNRHTLGQVTCGALNGFLCVFIMTAF